MWVTAPGGDTGMKMSDTQTNTNVSVDPAYLKMLEDSWKKQQAQPDLQQQLNEQFAKVNERLDQLERGQRDLRQHINRETREARSDLAGQNDTMLRMLQFVRLPPVANTLTDTGAAFPARERDFHDRSIFAQ